MTKVKIKYKPLYIFASLPQFVGVLAFKQQQQNIQKQYKMIKIYLRNAVDRIECELRQKEKKSSFLKKYKIQNPILSKGH